MHKYYISLLLVRLVLPASLLLGIALRPFGLSLIYLLLYLISPFPQVPDSATFQGCRGKCLQLNFIVSILLLLVHGAWHSILAGFPPYGSLLEQYPIVQTIGYNLGLVSYVGIEPLMAVHYLAPELVVMLASVAVYFVVRSLLMSSPSDEISRKDTKYQRFPLLTSAGKYMALFLLMFSGIMRPSVTSGIYFLVFMGAATAWALGKPLEKGFAVVSRCVMAIMGVHIAVLLVYQCTWIMEIYPPDRDMARYFGLTKLVILNETEAGFTYEVTDDYMWATLASPLVILFSYFFLAIETRELFKPKARKKNLLSGLEAGKLNGSLVRVVSFNRGSRHATKEKWKSATKKVRLLRGASPSKRWSARALHQDSTGSVVVPDEESVTEIAEPTLMDDIVAAVVDFFQVLIRSSYIATTITMMAWSIMFHSWLTFVFLMWANIVWLCQDQRSFMLKTSPVLVLYAMLLLVAQYVYGMNLTESELPSNITEVNLQQIGLGRSSGEPCVPLLIKSLFTCMFWVTLRQRVQELRAKSDQGAPLQLTSLGSEERPSRLLSILGDCLRAACARYWIYVVVIMLFVIGITGERMTIFRIIYMFLFLVFILMFQISWYWWRRLMYVFWITVIIYSMINLILIYIYQFDNFSKTIETYLLINERLQHDLGLEPYHPADLFVKLLTPTLFLIITIMQVHYFHKDFMALSDPKTRTNSLAKEPDSGRPSQGGISTQRDDVPPLPLEDRPAGDSGPAETAATSAIPPTGAATTDAAGPSAERRPNSDTEPDHSIDTASMNATTKRSIFRKLSRNRSYTNPSESGVVGAARAMISRRVLTVRRNMSRAVDLVFALLDLHLLKIIFLSLMLLCVFNVSAMHVPIMLIISPALLLSGRKQRLCVLFISILISVYFMAKMVYQIEYIKHSYFDVNCTRMSENDTLNVTTYNNAEWVGFRKTTQKKPLVSLLQGYIGLIAVFTFYSLVTYRQRHIRDLGLMPNHNEKIMFPEVTRKEADKDLLHCLKYFVNYGFYKFGVEMTLICLMGVIGSRMDVYAAVYAGWLLVLAAARRARLCTLWSSFTATVTVLVPLQYLIAVGFIPNFCVQYPWSGNDQQMKHVRTWLFLPYTDEPPHAVKLVFDYFLVLFASRQLRVFRLEKNQGDSYPGGSNSEDVGKDWETPNFVNPVPDFLGYVGSWLDVLKRMIFLGMLWVTLAIMFMTGTNRVNLFSMGYLIGSFIFLWQGTDFYLRPKEAILQWWSWLLRYNVCVVAVKALLQIPGCMFAAAMQEHACWLVQLLGIGCVDKFAGGNIARFLKMQYDKDSACSVPQEDIGLAWDGVCFAFLILQRRLFHSYYFYRVIDESKATTVLASRGADLIEELRQKQMNVQEEQEVKILEKIKVKMERIKANQKKIQGVMSKEPVHHDAVTSNAIESIEEEDEEEEEEETQPGESEQIPLVRGDSEESRRGYHTPTPATPRGFHTPISEPSAPPSPVRPTLPPILPLGAPSSQGGPPSPSSALMTVSLDAYLEPRRISFESPPSSDLLPRAQSPEESYPVFSPPPIRRRHTVASPSLLQRTSIISHSSRAEPHSHHTSVRSGDYYMFDEFDDTDIHLKDDDSSSDEDAPKEMGFGKLVSTVIKTDVRRAVSLRRASMPAVRSRRPSRPSSATYPFSFPQQRTPPSPRAQSVRETDVDIRFDSDRDRPAVAPDIDDYAPPPETWVDKLKGFLETAGAFMRSILVSLTRHLMKYSRDYRYVSRTLSVEKKRLKEKEGFGIGRREGSQMIWEPLPETLLHQEMENYNNHQLDPQADMGRKLSVLSVPEIRILAASAEGLDESPDQSTDQSTDSDDTSEHESAFSLQTTGSKDVTTLEEQDDSMFKQQKSPLLHLTYALWYAVLAHTDVVCYIMVFINQIQSATILSIPLPLMVFLWGTLTIPRPTKTFWVTLIAYTEVIVLIKSMFQFEILPWNQKAIPANMPFTAPRIIGIERKYNYALYDLLLLLIIFLHRFMLKSLGLWKESTPEAEVREDMEYRLSPSDTQMLVEGHGAEVGRKYLHIHDRPLRSTENRMSHMTGGQTAATEDECEQRDRGGDDAQEPGTSKMADDEHYKVNDDQEPIIAVTTTLEDTYSHYPDVIALSMKRYLRPTMHFFQRMLTPGARVTADIYAYMFLCDFFNFLVVIFGFAAFGTHQGDGGVQAYLEENKVPIPFLVMLILQFALIVIDRALYLRKFMLGKILFQYGLIIGVHIWMFFVLPFITERTFNALLPPPMWYMMKCIYLLLSAYQIRCGYPRRIIGNFLCKSYHFLNMICFRGFMAVPFLFELRTLMDWIWTDTSMTLMDWLKMEDIFASVFLLKCSRYVEDEFPQPRGAKKSATSKYLLGGGVLTFVIAIIWFPLVFFAFGNSVGQPNPPTDVTVKIRIGPFLPVYQMSAQSHNIDVYTEQDYTQLSNHYARDRNAQTFLSNYMYNDVAVVTINPNSTMKWQISPPELARLEREAVSNASLMVKFTYVITHPSNNAENPPTMESNREVALDAYIAGVRNTERDTLLQLLAGTAPPDTWLNVKTLFPKFVKVFNKGTTKPAYQLMPPISGTEDDDARFYRNVQLRLEREKDVMYWRVREACESRDFLASIPMNNCDMLVMYTFNDKLFPETLNFISGGGIIGLYTTFVFLASRVLRGFFSGIYTKIMFDDLPNVDRVLQLCLDIYLVREALELSLEEDLFAKLVFLYRSPETMIKWSRPKEDEQEQRALPAPQ
ncbi:piezo-type mechanosensitive ion channel component isoform X1 [Danaus plexippus]|uniref:piezo-type mechanosensitive ion channel component isoform X1 n=1 Tax=Danaus plexippus TaxID=13037 RepID=UPI002AB1B2D3|nr:piezo-type mechanosensitive ion channel component isoform X1 [Danaus plexippus]